MAAAPSTAQQLVADLIEADGGSYTPLVRPGGAPSCGGDGAAKPRCGLRYPRAVALLVGVALLSAALAAKALSKSTGGDRRGVVARRQDGTVQLVVTAGLRDDGHSCKAYGCGEAYVPERRCQCNPACRQHGSCCHDYDSVCSKQSAPVGWEVAFKGTLDVWGDPGMVSPAIGQKRQCSVFRGRRKGDWVELEGEPGYLMVSYLGEELLRQRDVAYAQVPEGTCESAGASPIRGEAACRDALASLGLPDDAAKSVEHPLPGRPGGCVLTGSAAALRQPGGGSDGVLCYRRDMGCGLDADVLDKLTQSRSHALSASALVAPDAAAAETTARATAAAPSSAGAAGSLYCFSVFRTTGYEPGLIKEQAAKGVSIFACDEYVLFRNGAGKPDIAPAIAQQIVVPRVGMGNYGVNGMTTNSWLNTLTFMKAWSDILQAGHFRKHDWVVKVDPDAVFFPDRLKTHLAAHNGAMEKMFLLNCDKMFAPTDKFAVKLFGAIEVFSRKAVEAYEKGEVRCQNELKWKGWGEDFYMQSCMDLLGVKSVADVSMLSDSRCVAASCTDPGKVVFHDFKNNGAYFQCWRDSLGPAGVKLWEREHKGA